MPDKIAPLGICDHCGGPIPRNRWYTSKGKPRLYCTLTCRNTANSHNGEPIRYQKMMDRIHRGAWTNPAKLHPPTSADQAARARKGRLREVAARTWRNPALAEAARRKLSRPRKHTGDLANAIQKLDQGLSVSDLTPGEAAAHRSYRRRLAHQKRQTKNTP